MERNLYILNLLPFIPTRVCAKNTGPGEVAFIMGPKIRKQMKQMTSPTMLPIMSIALFTKSSKAENFTGM